MNIKSLLLGSAAALVAVSGARAADAPVTMVEPEPVEYVRVCDVYGTGFFYIPGTETCLKIGGYVRVRFQGNDRQYNGDIDNEGFAIDDNGDGFTRNSGDDYNIGVRTRARLDFDAREETELGTLRAKIRLEATNNPSTGNSSAAYAAEEAYLQLGGLTVGYLDSAWTADDGGISDGLLTDTDWAAGDFQANRISYTAAFSGFSGTVSVEDDGSGDFIPDVIAKLSYKGGFGGAYIMGVYDEDSFDYVNTLSYFGRRGDGIYGNYFVGTDEFNGDDGADGAFVVKGGVQLENLILADSILKVEGHWASDPSRYALVGNVFTYSNGGGNNLGRTVDPTTGIITGNGSFAVPSQWQVGAAYQQTFGKLFAAVSGVYGETFDLSGTFNGFDFNTGLGVVEAADISSVNYFGVAGNVGYQVTKNFSVLGEVSYVNFDIPGSDRDNQTRGFLEFKRTF
ncbi:porin [Aureimonas endophytica]|uniref:Porin n=2 Tax=Aureimonas endophytica TaxID=2027858 RepID=A0A916ZEW5_9HYPH|nr:porin [Aureimonas endophytica]GGD93116.1 porin [Aureimonas endophytica]